MKRHEAHFDRAGLRIRRLMRWLCGWAPGIAARLAERLWFARPARPRFTAAHDALLDGATPLELEVGDRSSSGWYWWGRGPRVLVVHGWNSHTGWMGPVIEALASAGAWVFAFDAPLHGRSGPGRGDKRRATMLEMAAMVESAIARHGPFDAIVAHSGGCMASVLALRTAAPVKRMVMLAPMRSFEPYVAAFQEYLGLTDAVQRAWRQRFARRFGFEWREFDVADVVSTPFAIPSTVILHDEDDGDTPIDGSEAIAAAWGGACAELVRSQGLGHRNILKDEAVLDRVVRHCLGQGASS